MITPYTPEQVRQQIYSTMKFLCIYWSDPMLQKTQEQRMHGLCFSILNIFDGTNVEFPAMNIVLIPHPEDKEVRIENGEEFFYEEGMHINDGVMMHEEFYK
jgi:hypothetical protein